MTTATMIQSGPAGATERYRTRTGVSIPGLLDAWRQRRAYRATLVDLRRLDDKGLRDIGLSREMIEPAARVSVYGK